MAPGWLIPKLRGENAASLGGFVMGESLRDRGISLTDEPGDVVDGVFGDILRLLSDVGEDEASSGCLELLLNQGRQPTSFPNPPAEDDRC